MIDRVTGNQSLPASVRHDIVERTDGIPLFVKEMTKAVLEASGEQAAQSDMARLANKHPIGRPQAFRRKCVEIPIDKALAS